MRVDDQITTGDDHRRPLDDGVGFIVNDVDRDGAGNALGFLRSGRVSQCPRDGNGIAAICRDNFQVAEGDSRVANDGLRRVVDDVDRHVAGERPTSSRFLLFLLGLLIVVRLDLFVIDGGRGIFAV